MSPDTVPATELWDAWTPQEVAARLSRCPATWAVAGGWALDLWLGQQSRPHGDIEIVVSSGSLRTVRKCLPEHIFYASKSGALHAIDAASGAGAHQFWVLDPAAMKWRLDVMTDPGDEQRWIYRRDPCIWAPRQDMLARTPEGIPYLRPEAVLLFKAKQPLRKDEADFLNALPCLGLDEKSWLKRALRLAHPCSSWIQHL